MPHERDMHNPNVSIGREGRRARAKNKAIKHRTKEVSKYQPGDLAHTPMPPMPSPEHYHIVYEYGGRAVPHFQKKYLSQRDAYLDVQRMGQASEPNTEWYDDGRVMIETALHDRTGMHRVILRIAGCIANQCRAVRESPIILPTNKWRVIQ